MWSATSKQSIPCGLDKGFSLKFKVILISKHWIRAQQSKCDINKKDENNTLHVNNNSLSLSSVALKYIIKSKEGRNLHGKFHFCKDFFFLQAVDSQMVCRLEVASKLLLNNVNETPSIPIVNVKNV